MANLRGVKGLALGLQNLMAKTQDGMDEKAAWELFCASALQYGHPHVSLPWKTATLAQLSVTIQIPSGLDLNALRTTREN